MSKNTNLGEKLSMRKISIINKTQIKQILQARGVLGVANGKYQEFRVLKLWWHNMEDGVCNCCESHLSDQGREMKHINLNEALKTLWRNRNSLYICGKYRSDDNGMNHYNTQL